MPPTRTSLKSERDRPDSLPGADLPVMEERKQFAYRMRRSLGEKFQLYAKYNRGMNAQDLMEELLEHYLNDKEIKLPGT